MMCKTRPRGSPPIENNEPNVDISDDPTLLQKDKTRVLLLFDKILEWAKDNEYILSGWRPGTNSYSKCFRSGTVGYSLSTAYHLFSNHSHATPLLCLKLEFLGILIAIAGIFSPGLWYTFPSDSRQVKSTWIAVILISIITLLSCFKLSLKTSE
ncbi:hypothetical protein EAE96_009121 [Botrytis aclada]|nr:hypothetical protein EAE96_009121 [Botrytis aclada]